MSAKDILCTYFYTNNFNRFKVITLTISNYGETWGGYFKTNYMKLYTEEQVIKITNAFYDEDCTMHDVIDILNSLTPIELPSDEEIETESHNHYLKGQLYIEPASDTEYAFKKGAKWMKDKILNQNI